MITIAYITCRVDCRIQWFFDSLHNELGGDYSKIELLVIDFWAQECDHWTGANVEQRRAQFAALAHHQFVHSPPKPTVWQGQHRLTKINYFAASNMRNTALCMAKDGYIVFVDDLSVLMPGWWQEVQRASSEKYVACGGFRKVINLTVAGGKVVDFRDHPAGWDPRKNHVPNDDPYPCVGGWMFGTSVGVPVDWLLEINGYDEDADSMSGEDYIAGIMLEKHGYPIKFCPKMFAYESEELHFIEKPFLRIIKPHSKAKDSSHVLLQEVQSGARPVARNYQNMFDTRKDVLCGGIFPVVGIPQHDWRDGQPLSEM